MATQIQTFPCDGTYVDPSDLNVTLRCSELVAARRPSSTGKHFCASKRCQAAKQRWYRQHRVEKAKLDGRDLVAALIEALLVPQRSHCHLCDHPAALVGWAHPGSGGGACFALGPLGPGLPPGLLGLANSRDIVPV